VQHGAARVRLAVSGSPYASESSPEDAVLRRTDA
jgi:hypothetical protein